MGDRIYRDMKAQYVYENIRFERGRDPEKSMEIGRHNPEISETRRKNRWREMNRDFVEAFGNFLHEDSYGFYATWEPYDSEDPGERFDTYTRVQYTGSEKKRDIKEWFKQNHPYFRVKSLKQGLSAPGIGGAAYLSIEYVDL